MAFVSELLKDDVAESSRAGSLSDTRSFLRYLNWEGVISEDLARLVPRVPCWRMSHIPDHLTWDEVRAVIDGIDTKEPTARRDRALLLLLATTGLRSAEVRRLELKDIHWRDGELHEARTKSCRERALPLLAETGHALADYVLRGRPRGEGDAVFVRHTPPFGPLSCSGTVAAIVRRRLITSGIRTRGGAHLFRHSLATRMVQQRCPVKEVADLLGHRSIDTTAIYVKVALTQLEEVALPFPGGAV
jgi:site-specific recombinase XerD